MIDELIEAIQKISEELIRLEARLRAAELRIEQFEKDGK